MCVQSSQGKNGKGQSVAKGPRKNRENICCTGRYWTSIVLVAMWLEREEDGRTIKSGRESIQPENTNDRFVHSNALKRAGKGIRS